MAHHQRTKSEWQSLLAGGTGCNRNDGQEALAEALDRAVAMPWRGDARIHAIVVISDNPAYPDRVAASLATARALSGITLACASSRNRPTPASSCAAWRTDRRAGRPLRPCFR